MPTILCSLTTGRESRYIHRKDFVRAALKDKDISESKGIILRMLEADEIQVIIAVYALDAEGKAKVYTKEITVPEPELTGQVAVTIDVPKDKIKLKSFEATLRQMKVAAEYMWDSQVQN